MADQTQAIETTVDKRKVREVSEPSQEDEPAAKRQKIEATVDLNEEPPGAPQTTAPEEAQQEQPEQPEAQQQEQEQQPEDNEQHAQPLQHSQQPPPQQQEQHSQILQQHSQILQQATNNNHKEARVEALQQFQQALQESTPKAFKLFVGQIPFSFNEENLTQIFSTFGNVLEAATIRDRGTGKHKGCAFVTFTKQEEAELAIETLHNKMTIPGMTRPMQVKYAESDKSMMTMLLLKRQQQLQQAVAATPAFSSSFLMTPKSESSLFTEPQEHKLFVGMIPKTATEQQVRALFEPFGRLIDFAYIKGAQAKNCAFVKYEALNEALRAIETLNEKCYLEGASQALVVRFADKDSSKRKMAPVYPMHFPVQHEIATIPFQSHHYGTPVPMWYQPHAASPMQAAPTLSHTTIPLQQQYQAMQPSTLMSSSQTMPGAASSAADYLTTPSRMNIVSAPAVRYQTSMVSAAPVYATQNPLAATPNRFWGSPATVPYNRGPPRHEGPSNCNLFIYHLPPFYGDTDLANLFAPFGNVLSATVFLDKATQTSKCFGMFQYFSVLLNVLQKGFVSYDSAQSALAAIQQMNGFQIGHKRLKVQLKKEK